MRRPKLLIVEKTRALTLLKQGMSVISVATDLKVTRMAIYNFKKAAASLPPGTIPPRKVKSGALKKTSLRTDMILKRSVIRSCHNSRRPQEKASCTSESPRSVNHSAPTAKGPENACSMCRQEAHAN
ncbi:hypothetical protein OTU49_001411 [Cherax quadricarinatus]|uniref:Uncharacterized protein n=1 Tax=Cherax quadricarinatus TaxID=27406 RepID=A0AAW0XUQ8_CHEQU